MEGERSERAGGGRKGRAYATMLKPLKKDTREGAIKGE